MPVGAIIGGGLALGSALIGSSASKKAANAQEKSAKYAADMQWKMYDQTRSDLAPWREAGGQAIGQGYAMLQPGYDHTTSPGYDFRFSEGQRAVESGAASKGMLMSGGTLKDLVRFGQGVAADDYNDQFNRTMAVAAGGQQAATSTGQMGMNAATGAGNAMMQAGNARASGYMGQANAWQQGLGNLASIFMGGF
jgi:hypothetical protein